MWRPLCAFNIRNIVPGWFGKSCPTCGGRGDPKDVLRPCRGLLHPFHFHHESIMLCLPPLGPRGRRAHPGLILNASLYSTSSFSILTQSQTFLVPNNNLDLCFSQHSVVFSSLSLQSPRSFPALLFKTPLKFNTKLKVQKLVENKATLFPLPYEPHSDWKPPPGLT